MNTAFNLLVSVQDTASSADGASLSSNVYRLDASSAGGSADDLVVHLSEDAGGDNTYTLSSLGFSQVSAVALKCRGGAVVNLGGPSGAGKADFCPDSLNLNPGDWYAWASQAGEDVSGGSQIRVNGFLDGAWTMIIVGRA